MGLVATYHVEQTLDARRSVRSAHTELTLNPFMKGKIILVEIPAKELGNYLGLRTVRVSGVCTIESVQTAQITYKMDSDVLSTWFRKGFYQFVAYIPELEDDECFQLIDGRDFDKALSIYSKYNMGTSGQFNIQKQYNQDLTNFHIAKDSGLIRIGRNPETKPIRSRRKMASSVPTNNGGVLDLEDEIYI